MYTFNYHKPATLAEAIALHSGADEGVYLAGGHTLLPAMKQRLQAPSDLIDLAGITSLAGVNEADGGVTIGSLTSHADVAESATVAKLIPALAQLASGIGDAQVRNRGTIGGSIANADPAADYPAAVLALNATIVTDRREIAADSFFTGMFETALEEGELIASIRFPRVERAAYAKFPNPASRYAMVGVFVTVNAGSVRVAVTGAAASVFRLVAAEQALARDLRPETITGLEPNPADLLTDMHGSAEYRANLVGVMARKAVSALL